MTEDDRNALTEIWRGAGVMGIILGSIILGIVILSLVAKMYQNSKHLLRWLIPTKDVI